MLIKPEIEALHSNPAVQRRVAQAVAGASQMWRDDPAFKDVRRGLESYSCGGALQDTPLLARLMQCHTVAQEFVARWSGLFLETLAQQPLAQIPFQHNYSGGFATMQLASAGNAALSLVCYEQRVEERVPEAAHFADCEQHEMVLAGTGRARLHRIRQEGQKSAAIDTEIAPLRPGECLATESRKAARSIFDVHGRLLMLQLTRQPADPAPTREYVLCDGRLLHQASGTKRDSLCEMAMAVLGAMGRVDAVPAMLAQSQSGPTELRWEALRHAIALETISGFKRLCEVAGDAADPLSGHAGRVRQQLLASYPQLAARETCHA